MKFAEHLTAHITPEWRKQYIHYEDMKSMLYAAIEQAPSAEAVEAEVLARYNAKFDEQFFSYCEKELLMINTFYAEKLAEATRKYSALKSELAATKRQTQKDKGYKGGGLSLGRKKEPAMKLSDLKLAFSEFYLSLILLQNYQNLNFTGFRKILKKHDKLFQTSAGAKWRTEHVENAHFYTNKDIDKLIHETETTFTQELESGDRQKAMKRLRVPPLGERKSDITTLKVGFFTGSFVVLFVAMILSAIFHHRGDDWRIIFRLYRPPMLIALFLFFMGLNVQGWRKAGVNHVLIFELDPRNHLSEQHLLELAAIIGVLWTLSVLGFLYSSALGIPAYANPLALVVTMLIFLLNPTRTLMHEARFWFLRVLGRVFCAPWFYVGFADFWLADQLNSLVPVLVDFQYMICFYATIGNWNEGDEYSKLQQNCVDNTWFIRPTVACLPSYFRLAQCLRRYRDTKEKFPHLANAVKYATTICVVIFSTLYTVHKGRDDDTGYPYFYLWIISSIISSLYAFTWDVKMDWGLFDKNAGDNKLLREEIVYGSGFYYYFGILEDFILRFGWAFSLSLVEMEYVHGDLMVSIISPLEVFRRFVWNFFRLENEHLNNCGKFRAVRDISVAPIDSSDQATILRMMDEEDGVVNRRVRKKPPPMTKNNSSAILGRTGTTVKFQNSKIAFEGESLEETDA